MTIVYIVFIAGTDHILSVCDSELLALKRQLYFQGVYENQQIAIANHDVEMIEMD
jgi:hypothetical protein